MNFLAHLFLADASPEAWIGSLLPDLARPGDLPRGPGASARRVAWVAGLPMATRSAIDQHRAADAFTDTHPIVHRSKARVRPCQGVYGGIVIDLLYDHILAREWNCYSEVPLPVFVARVHAGFASHAHLIPPVMRYPVARLIEQDWLASYATVEGVTRALRRLSQRLAQRFDRPVHLETAAADLAEHRAELAADFHEFFPQLVAYCRTSGGPGSGYREPPARGCEERRIGTATGARGVIPGPPGCAG
jgi:acyl carrier protein phosphodiesterase